LATLALVSSSSTMPTMRSPFQICSGWSLPWTVKNASVHVDVPADEEDDYSKYMAPEIPSAPACLWHQDNYDDFEDKQYRKREQQKEESDHGGSSTSTEIPPQNASQQQEPQQQQPQQQPPPGQLVYPAARNGKSSRAPDGSIVVFIRVKKSKANERRKRKLIEEIGRVGARGQEKSVNMWVDVPEKTSSLSQCKQANLHLDGDALGELGDCTRYDVRMYINDAKPEVDLGEKQHSHIDFSKGWHPYGINEFGGDKARPTCTVKEINMEQLLQGKGSSIYLGVRLIPVIPSANP